MFVSCWNPFLTSYRISTLDNPVHFFIPPSLPHLPTHIFVTSTLKPDEPKLPTKLLTKYNIPGVYMHLKNILLSSASWSSVDKGQFYLSLEQEAEGPDAMGFNVDVAVV